MDKAYRDEFYRSYVIERLPSSVSPSDPHLQIYDNYVAGTRLRFRRIRVPGIQEWKKILQQRIGGEGHFRFAEIILDDAEYRALGAFDGNEIRKNRYFAEIEGLTFEYDLFLGALSGLTMVKVLFPGPLERDDFEPVFSGIDVTIEAGFDGSSLFRSDIAAVRSMLGARSDDPINHQTFIGEIAGENE